MRLLPSLLFCGTRKNNECTIVLKPCVCHIYPEDALAGLTRIKADGIISHAVPGLLPCCIQPVDISHTSVQSAKRIHFPYR